MSNTDYELYYKSHEIAYSIAIDYLHNEVKLLHNKSLGISETLQVHNTLLQKITDNSEKTTNKLNRVNKLVKKIIDDDDICKNIVVTFLSLILLGLVICLFLLIYNII